MLISLTAGYLRSRHIFCIFATNSYPRGDAHCVNIRLTTPLNDSACSTPRLFVCNDNKMELSTSNPSAKKLS